MAKEGSVAQYLLIIAFAAAVVVLGAQELNHRYVRSGNRGGSSGRELVKELHGEFDVLRGRLGQSQWAASNNDGESKNTPEPKRETKSAASAPAQKSSKEATSANGGEDKEQLQQVIDSLVP